MPAEIEGHVTGMRITCMCSDNKLRDVALTGQLIQSVLNLIKHRQGGRLQLMEAHPSQERKGGDADKYNGYSPTTD